MASDTLVETPKVDPATFYKASVKYKEGDYQSALELFIQADRDNPGQADCVVMIGSCYELLGDVPKALTVLQYATELDNHCDLAWYHLALITQRLGDHKRAKLCFMNAYRDRYVGGSVDYTDLITRLVSLLRSMGENQLAAKYLEELMIKYNQKHPLAILLSDIYQELNAPAASYSILRHQLFTNITKERPSHSYVLDSHQRMKDILYRLSPPSCFMIPNHPTISSKWNDAIKAAIKQIANPNIHVLDLDSMGWIGMLCYKAGAFRVTCAMKPWDALHAALETTFALNNMPPTQLHLQVYHDLVISPSIHLVAMGATSQDIVPQTISRSYHLQQQGVKTIPQKGRLHIIGIQCDQIRKQGTIHSEVNGFDLTIFADSCKPSSKYIFPFQLQNLEHLVLTEEVCMDVDSGIEALLNNTFQLSIIKEGNIDALVSWYDLVLWEDIEVSMGPGPTSPFKQNVQILHLSQDREVHTGDKLILHPLISRWKQEPSIEWMIFEPTLVRSTDDPSNIPNRWPDENDPLEGRFWHFDMLSDTERNDAYEAAIPNTIKPSHVVLDIGTGSGLLSMMAARSGAKHIYAIEMNPAVAETARKVINANGLSDKITVICGKSTDIDVIKQIPEKIDVIVTETMGTDLLSELMYSSVDDARRNLLSENGCVIPSSGRIWAQLIQINSPWNVQGLSTMKVDDISLNLEPINQVLPPVWQSVRTKLIDYTTLSDTFLVFDFDLMKPINGHGAQTSINVPVTTKGNLHGVLFWWDATLAQGPSGPIIIDVGPESRYASMEHGHWSQTVQMIFPSGVPLSVGDQVPVDAYNDFHITLFEITRLAQIQANQTQKI